MQVRKPDKCVLYNIILPLLRLTYMEELRAGPFVNKNKKSKTTVKIPLKILSQDEIL
jgi:hypothetical protein